MRKDSRWTWGPILLVVKFWALLQSLSKMHVLWAYKNADSGPIDLGGTPSSLLRVQLEKVRIQVCSGCKLQHRLFAVNLQPCTGPCERGAMPQSAELSSLCFTCGLGRIAIWFGCLTAGRPHSWATTFIQVCWA